jgi:hypothetical protein
LQHPQFDAFRATDQQMRITVVTTRFPLQIWEQKVDSDRMN